MRKQWCCEQIDKIAQECGLSEEQVKEVKDRNNLVEQIPAFAELSPGTLRPLIRERDPVVKEKAISHIQNALKRETPQGGKYHKKLTADDVKKVINKLKADEKPKIELPDNKFNVILADPPWKYDFSSTVNREIENQYPTMELHDICNVQVPSADNCILFLWGTAPKLQEALQVIAAWGFTYKTNAIWDKKIIGMGYYFRGQHELLLVGTKGNPGVPDPENRVSSVIESKRTEHSKKPDIIYEIIEKMYPGKKYFELFARNKRPGWESWGNEL